jgi:hypothetical protein
MRTLRKTLPELQPHGKQAVDGFFCHRTNKEYPVITAGFSTPVSSRIVGARSPKTPNGVDLQNPSQSARFFSTPDNRFAIPYNKKGKIIVLKQIMLLLCSYFK